MQTTRYFRLSFCCRLMVGLSIVLICGFLIGCSGGGGADVLRTEFWVSPDGNDSSPGTRSEPFLTLERARDAVRSLDKTRRDGQIIVYLRGGDYRLDRPLVLDWRDSGRNGHSVIYRAAPDEHPVLSGSLRVQEWSLYDTDLGIYRAYVGRHESRQLYVNGQRAIRARTEAYRGLLDQGMFPGLPSAHRGEWGIFSTPTPSSGNKILNNRIQQFLSAVWNGGAIYTTGQQGTSMTDALLIEGNVASGKRRAGGGNTFYTDGGSRYIVLKGNVSFDNPRGVTDFGPPSKPSDPLPYPPYSALNNIPYGSDSGGCVTYGDISFVGNYWLSNDFFNICPYAEGGVSYPTNLTYQNNHVIQGPEDVPQSILDAAGVHDLPRSILDAAGGYYSPHENSTSGSRVRLR